MYELWFKSFSCEWWITLKYPPFPLLPYFSVVVCLRCLLHHILSFIADKFRENRGFVFMSIVQFMMSANSRIRFGMHIVLVCLYSTPSHYHHCANLSEDIELLKCLSDIFCRVCKIKHILSIIHYTICGAVCFQFTHFSCDNRENIYTLSYYHHQIGSMKYYPLFRVRSWNNGVRLCLSIFVWLITSTMALNTLCIWPEKHEMITRLFRGTYLSVGKYDHSPHKKFFFKGHTIGLSWVMPSRGTTFQSVQMRFLSLRGLAHIHNNLRIRIFGNIIHG